MPAVTEAAGPRWCSIAAHRASIVLLTSTLSPEVDWTLIHITQQPLVSSLERIGHTTPRCLHRLTTRGQFHSRACALAFTFATCWKHPRVLRTALSAATIVCLNNAKGARFFSEYLPC
jgi:hypothetical protein